MVAYNFMKRFIEPIRCGLGLATGTHPKRQTIRTIRNAPARHARPGETLQLYYGLRTKHCMSIGVAQCASVDDITLHPHHDMIVIGRGVALLSRKMDAFARDDGFEDWPDMRRFWIEVHGDQRMFRGVLILWRPLIEMPAAA